MRYKTKKNGKRKDFVIYEKAQARLTWLQKQCTKGTSESYIINEAILAYHMDDIAVRRQKIIELAKEQARIGDEIKKRQEELSEFIAEKSNAANEEICNVFEARPETRKRIES